uniref:C-type lectin domain-containing protein n=1 Tax=Xiphophorus maculatus TaxID=8083 RepID=A0A3B5QGX0_XIPMA
MMSEIRPKCLFHRTHMSFTGRSSLDKKTILNWFKNCQVRWRMFRCSCYFLSTTSGSWNKSREDCGNRGGDLVVISDDDEQKFVFALTETSAWIGLRKETEGSWKWVDGTALKGQPDNSGGKEDCVQIWGNSKTWNDDKCDAKIKWICEKALM